MVSSHVWALTAHCESKKHPNLVHRHTPQDLMIDWVLYNSSNDASPDMRALPVWWLWCQPPWENALIGCTPETEHPLAIRYAQEKPRRFEWLQRFLFFFFCLPQVLSCHAMTAAPFHVYDCLRETNQSLKRLKPLVIGNVRPVLATVVCNLSCACLCICTRQIRA